MALRGVARWTDPGWRAEHLAWATDRLAELGRQPVGEAEQRARPWSTVFRIPTDRGVAWSKANGPGAAHEGPLLEALRQAGESNVLLPLAVATDQPWLLLDDGGPTLRSLVAADGRAGDTELAKWIRILPTYARLQRRMEGHVEAMRAAGVPDERPAAYPAILARLLADDGPWTRVDDVDRDRAEATRSRLAALAPVVRDLSAELAASGIPSTVEHGDLHGNNILTGTGTATTPRFFDWGDGVIAHPFGTLTSTFGSAAHHAGVDAYGQELHPVRDAYTQAWREYASTTDLGRIAAVAMDLGHLNKAVNWERSLVGLEPDEMGGHHGATSAWLGDFVDRLDRVA
jgi:hypothetical protein